MNLTQPTSESKKPTTNGTGNGNDFAKAAAEIAHMFEHEGNVGSVFGAPTKLDTKTVIPVAYVNVGSGGGGMLVPAAQRFWQRLRRLLPARLGAGGGGFGIHVRPIGYLHEEDGHVVFTRIDVGAHPPPGIIRSSR